MHRTTRSDEGGGRSDDGGTRTKVRARGSGGGASGRHGNIADGSFDRRERGWEWERRRG